MKFIKVIFLCLVFSYHGSLVYASSNANSQGVAGADDMSRLKNYVEDLIKKAYNIVNDPKLSGDAKVKRSSDLLWANLHLVQMARYTLGRYQKGLLAAKVKEFTDVYSRFIVQAYASLVRDYSNEQAIVKYIKKVDKDMYIVNTELIKPDSPEPVMVDYLVYKVGNGFKVMDIITENVSILNSQQSEFDNVLSNPVQGIDWLINDLKQKEKAK